MTNSEKDELAGEYGLNLPDTVSDEQARFITDKNILYVLGGQAYDRKVARKG
jgi:hypothetical protein